MMTRKLSWAYFVAILFAIIVLSYYPIIDSYFLSDDFNHIFALQGPDGAPRWWLALQHWWSPQHFISFRPLVTLYELIVFSAFGAEPIAFHSANLFVHLCNSVVLAVLAQRLAAAATIERPHTVAMATGILFAIHPLHSEAVVWIASVPVLLCTFFYLLSLIATFNWIVKGGLGWLLAALAAFVLALASKEEAVSLPGVVALMALFLHLRKRGWRNMKAGVMEVALRTLPFAIVLALYFLYRIQIFGSAISVVSFDGLRQVLVYIQATLNSAARFLEPVNFVHAGEIGATLASAYKVIFLLALAVGSWALLRRSRNWLLWAGFISFGGAAFAILMVPGHPVLWNGPELGLDLSRFLYIPSAAAVFVLAGLLFSQPGHMVGLRWLAFGALCAASVVTLRINNDAWRLAGEMMRQMQLQVGQATGRDPRAEVVNMPDKVSGVYFDRGGWRFAQLAPFGEGGRSGLAWRRLEIVNDLPSEVTIAARGTEDGFGPDAPLPPVMAGGERVVVDWRFDPAEAKSYSGSIVAIGLCGRMGDTPVVSLRGAGKDLSLAGTAILAAIVETRPIGDLMEVDIRVMTPDAGPTVADVRIDLPPGGPFELVESIPAFDVPSGEDRTVTIRVKKRAEGAAWPTQPVSVYAANAGAAPLTLEHPALLLPNPGGTAESIGRPPRIRPGDAPVEPLLLSRYCGQDGAAAPERDFGPLSVEPHLSPVGEPVTVFPNTPPMRLFWDDQRKRLVPFERAAKAPLILEQGPLELSQWTTPPTMVKHLAGHWGLATHAKQSPITFTSPVLAALDPTSVSYAVIEMRLSMSPSPFAFFDWSGSPESFVARGTTIFVVVPDGRWRTYAIPLHSDGRWNDGPVRQLRLSTASGYVEMRSFRLVGPIP